MVCHVTKLRSCNSFQQILRSKLDYLNFLQKNKNIYHFYSKQTWIFKVSTNMKDTLKEILYEQSFLNFSRYTGRQHTNNLQSSSSSSSSASHHSSRPRPAPKMLPWKVEHQTIQWNNYSNYLSQKLTIALPVFRNTVLGDWDPLEWFQLFSTSQIQFQTFLKK